MFPLITLLFSCIPYVFCLQLYLFLERGTGGEKRERNISAVEKHQLGASPTPPKWGPGPQPRHVPRQGIELATLQLAGWHPVH